MKPFTVSEVAGFQKAQSQTLMSRCKIRRVSKAFDDLGDAINSYSESSEISVGVKLESEGKASFRLKVGTDISIDDQVVITQMLSQPKSLVYQINEIIPSGINMIAKGVLIG